jgi:hypothetical protein
MHDPYGTMSESRSPYVLLSGILAHVLTHMSTHLPDADGLVDHATVRVEDQPEPERTTAGPMRNLVVDLHGRPYGGPYGGSDWTREGLYTLALLRKVV